MVQENTLRRNRGNGIVLGAGSTATISGGLITLNGYAGIYLQRGPPPPLAWTARQSSW